MMVVVFRSRLRPEAQAEYAEVAPEIGALALQQPGLISVKTFSAADGERVTLAEFESEEAVAAWREHPRHREAQQQGRDTFYSEYKIQICAVQRARDFHATEG